MAAVKHERHRALWQLAEAAIACVDPVFASKYSAIAVSNGFVGSPHIDMHDVDVQYAFSCGTFRSECDGGRLCIEETPMMVAEVDTYNKLAKVDGRFPHWVTPCEYNWTQIMRRARKQRSVRTCPPICVRCQCLTRERTQP